MRKLIWLVVFLGALWSGWWWLATTLVDRGVREFVAAQQAQGWQADIRALDMSGYPFAFDARFLDVAVRDPQGQSGVVSTQLDISTPAYWPGDITLRLPQTPVTFTLNGMDVTLRAQAATAEINLHPETALTLEATRAHSAVWQIDTVFGNLVQGTDFKSDILQLDDAPNSYAIRMSVRDLTPGDVLRRAQNIPDTWPRSLDRLNVDVTVHLDAPLDRHSTESRTLRPRAIVLKDVEIIWGDLRIAALGAVDIDADGLPKGEITLEVQNWRGLIDQAVRSGFVAQAQRGQAELILSAMANLNGGPDDLNLPFRMTDGQMFLGPIALGSVAPLTWR